MSVPQLRDYLPEQAAFVRAQADECHHGRINNWTPFVETLRQFYTPDQMAKIEGYIPGWGQMASDSGGRTLIHVTSVLTALYLLPEYQQATSDQKAIMEWMVLYHDVTKTAKLGEHDYIHGFRSAAAAGRSLPLVGFSVSKHYADEIESWYNLTYNAVVYDAEHGETIQDNRHLPQITQGIVRLFGADSPVRLVIGGVLFHISIKTDPDYPILAPLTDRETRRYIDADLFPTLKVMMLVDTSGWNLFDPVEKERQRALILGEFERIGTLITVTGS